MKHGRPDCLLSLRERPSFRGAKANKLLAFCCAIALTTSPALAQLPTTQLTSIFPPGGKQSANFEVTIAGNDLDDCSQLLFTHSGIKATQTMTPATDIEPAKPIGNQFGVTIKNDVPPGIYEVRALGRFGLSNPRSFVVGTFNETTDSSSNITADKAVEIPIGATINGRIEANNFEFLKLQLKKNERVLIETTARRIDSRLDPTLVLLDPSRREIKKVKEGAGADPVLDFTAPEAGAYLLKLYDEVYGGGNDFFYRLSVSAAPFVDFIYPPSGTPGTTTQFTLYGRNLPGGKPVEGLTCRGAPLEKLPVNITLPDNPALRTRLELRSFAPLARAWQDAVEYRLPTPSGPSNPVSIYFAKTPAVVLEQEPNNDSKHAQKVAVPCELAGQFYPERDMDWVEFDAKKGQTLWIEAICNQLGLPADPFFAIYRVKKDEKGQEQLTEVAQADDTQDRGRRNPNTEDFDVTSDDPSYKFVAPDDASYRLLVRDQFGDTRKDASFVYRLAIREPRPDFRLLAYPTSPPPTTQLAVQTPLATASIRRGGTLALAIVAQRRDEFDGEINISVEGLPLGVTCPGAVLGGDVSTGSLVLVAAEDASAWAGPIKVTATAKISGREVRREARYAVVVWGTPNRAQQPGEFRLAPGLSLGVIAQEMEPALVRIGEDKIYETSLGGNVEIPISIARRGDFKDPVKLVAVGLTQQMRPKDVTFDGDKLEGKFELALNQQNIRPGSYTFYMKGETKRNYTRNPEAVTAAEAEQKRIDEMIKTINDEVKSATEAKNEVALKAAQEKLKAATDVKTQCEKRVDDAEKANQPKNLSIALVSTPVRLRINSSPLKLTADKPAAIKLGAKLEIPIHLERLYGFSDQVELTLEPPAGVKGLTAEKVTLKKEETQARLQPVAAPDTPAGSHLCTLRARARFNNIQVESTLPITLVIEQ